MYLIPILLVFLWPDRYHKNSSTEYAGLNFLEGCLIAKCVGLFIQTDLNNNSVWLKNSGEFPCKFLSGSTCNGKKTIFLLSK